MANKKASPERQLEIIDYKIARTDFQIDFYTTHNISERKITKMQSKKTKFLDKKSKL